MIIVGIYNTNQSKAMDYPEPMHTCMHHHSYSEAIYFSLKGACIRILNELKLTLTFYNWVQNNHVCRTTLN